MTANAQPQSRGTDGARSDATRSPEHRSDANAAPAETPVRNVFSALAAIGEPWQPHRLASVNDYDLKVVKLDGEFVWHSHRETDELFLVVSGTLVIQLRDREVVLGPNDVFVVPRGVEHCPRAEGEVAALLIEPRGTVNTGDAGGPRTSAVRELPGQSARP
jgi:mannose-6-phosphate isomerase-like protein (cupin superfamily)